MLRHGVWLLVIPSMLQPSAVRGFVLAHAVLWQQTQRSKRIIE